MSRRGSAAEVERRAHVFAALGDPVRLTLVSKLVDGGAHSISSLTTGTKITRQAVTKHLRVLQDVGVVHVTKHGREMLYGLDPKPLASIKDYLEVIGQEWEQTLGRLRDFLEG